MRLPRGRLATTVLVELPASESSFQFIDLAARSVAGPFYRFPDRYSGRRSHLMRTVQRRCLIDGTQRHTPAYKNGWRWVGHNDVRTNRSLPPVMARWYASYVICSSLLIAASWVNSAGSSCQRRRLLLETAARNPIPANIQGKPPRLAL